MKTSFVQKLNLFQCALCAVLLCNTSSAMAQDSSFNDAIADSRMYDVLDDRRAIRNTPAPTPLQTAIGSLQQTTDKAKRTKIQTQIDSLLNQQYESYLKQNESELNKMEQRLKGLRNQLQRRRSAKELLVELELKRILNEADGLAWPTGQRDSRYDTGSFEPNRNDFQMGPPEGRSFEPRRNWVMPGETPRTTNGLYVDRSNVYRSRQNETTVLDSRRPEDERRLLDLSSQENETTVLDTRDFMTQVPNRTDVVLTSVQSLGEIGLACLNHESANRRLPSNIKSPDGKPLLSWRVAILPFLSDNGGQLYEKFHLDEPWYSEHNKALLEEIPNVFKDIEEGGTKTSILGFEMEGAMFEKNKKLTLGDIRDGTSNTILAIEAAEDLAVEWTKPADISLGDYKSREPKRLFRSGEANTLVCDGSTHQISEDVVTKDLQNLILRNDGQGTLIQNVIKERATSE